MHDKSCDRSGEVAQARSYRSATGPVQPPGTYVLVPRRFRGRVYAEGIRVSVGDADASEIEALIEQHVPLGAHAILVRTRREGARASLRSAVVGGRCVALHFGGTPRSVESSRSETYEPTRARAVLAEWDERFLSLGRRWLRFFREDRHCPARDWMATRIGAATLCRRLASGARLCVYFGHGRPEGFSGYHGLYCDEILAQPMRMPVDTFLSFACDHLTQPGNRPSFGRRLWEGGRVRAFWGAVGRVETSGNRKLAALGLEVLRCDAPTTVAQWLCSLHVRTQNSGHRPAKRAWSMYRLVGDPEAPI